MIILASGSPRREQLFELITLDFEVKIPNINEEIPEGTAPDTAVAELSLLKAKQFENGVDTIVAADTVVASPDGKILGKPKDEQEAFDMLKSLSGKKHTVYTGLTVITPEKTITEVITNIVTFYKIKDDQQIWDYVKTGESMDKAGGYGIQDNGGQFVRSVKGEYFGIVGLPVKRTRELLNL